MMSIKNIKKDDIVAVLTGKDKGAQGPVIEILPCKGKVKVKDVAIITRHKKARKQGDTPAIVKKESFIDISNVMLVCSSCKKPGRVGFVSTKDGRKERICKRCNKST